MAIREQSLTGDPQQLYIELNSGSTLRFMPGSRLINEHSVDGTIRLNVFMRGGVLEDASLPAHDKLLINRIYPPNISEVSVRPIPAIDAISVETESKQFSEFTITNPLGQQIMEGAVTGNLFSIPITRLPSGVYFLTVRGNKGHATQKWVKL